MPTIGQLLQPLDESIQTNLGTANITTGDQWTANITTLSLFVSKWTYLSHLSKWGMWRQT